MTQTEIATAIVSMLNDSFEAQDRIDILVAQDRQANQQDMGTTPLITFSPIQPAQNVSQAVTYDYDMLIKSTEFTSRNSYQFNAAKLATEDQTETAHDIAQLAVNVMQTQYAANTLSSLGLNIEKIEDVRDTWFQNESGGWDNSPSFDLTFYTANTIQEVFNSINELSASIHVI